MAATGPELNLDAANRALARGNAEEAEKACKHIVAAQPHNAAGWHLLGLAQQRLKRLDAAVHALSKAASFERGSARYHHDLANALMEQGKVDQAITGYRRALRTDDSLAEVHNDLGTAYFQKGWYAEAQECFQRALERAPEHGIAAANLGAALRAQGHLRESRRAFQRALVLKLRAALPRPLRWKLRRKPVGDATKKPASHKPEERELVAASRALLTGHIEEGLRQSSRLAGHFPEDPDVLHVYANALAENRQFPSALAKIDAAIGAEAERAEYHLTRARILVLLNRHEEAMEAGGRALTLEPGSADIFATVAGVFHPWRDDLAAQAARRAIEIDPGCALGHANLAAALWTQGQLQQAERHAHEALRLEPEKLAFRSNYALILKDLGRMDEAIALYRQLLNQAPNYPRLSMDMGALAVECEGDLEAARGWLRKAQRLSDNPRAFFSAAIVELLAGRFEAAWPLYEHRKILPDQRHQHSLFASFPQWQGEPLAHGRLLVYGEQGLGDEIMFASIFPDLAKRVPNITVVCHPRLGWLFRRSFPSFEIIAEPRDTQGTLGRRLKNIQCAVAAGSLGQYFRRRAEDFPVRESYLVPDAERASQWRQRIDALGAGLKIGVSWIGGLQTTGRSRRSLSLEQLRALLEVPGVTWISLQYTDCTEEISAFAANGPKVHEFDGATDDIDNLASLISTLDMVVSVCNTNVHVAGAIGKEVLVMAPFVPEWRYGMTGERMPWYRSARVFRQAAYGQWDRVIQRVKEALEQRLVADSVPR